MSNAGFNSSGFVRGRLQAALYSMRKKNRQRRSDPGTVGTPSPGYSEDTWGNSLIGTEGDALAIYAPSGDTVRRRVGGAITYSGDINTFLSGSMSASPKMVELADGSMGWIAHNIMTSSADYSGINWTRVGVTLLAGQADTLGGTAASRLTASGAACNMKKAPAGVVAGRYHTAQFIVRAGTALFAYIDMAATASRRVWFNLTTGAVATAEAGVTGAIFTTDYDGVTALPAGCFRIVATAKCDAALTVWLAISNADNSTTITVGRTITVERANLNFGSRPVTEYLATTTLARYGVPFSWRNGERRIVIEGSATYNSKYGDDLTQTEWVKTNATTAWNATGPHLEPCSTLTATAANATCIQSITSASSTQYFTAFVRRKTGTGPVSITVDNGSTWTDITSLINGSTYTRVGLDGNANPAVGFKLTTSGDEIEVALAINAVSDNASSPVPTYAAATVVRSADSLGISSALFPTGTDYTMFIDFDRTRLPVATGAVEVPISLQNTAGTQYARIVTSANGYSYSINDGTSLSANFWTFAPAERMQVCACVSPSNYSASFNGDPTLYIPGTRSPTIQQLSINPNGSTPIYIKRVLLVPRAVNDDGLRTFRYDDPGNRILADVTAIREGAGGLKGAREPTVMVLSDDGTTAKLLVGASQKNIINNGTHPEQPNRFVMRRYSYNRTTRALTALDSSFRVVYTPTGWALGNGGGNAPTFIKVASGTHAGRLLCFFNQNDEPSGDASGSFRILNLYRVYSDDDGDTWSAPTLMLAGSGFDGRIIVPGANGSHAQFPASHPTYPSRIVFAAWSFNLRQHLLYTDDGGDTLHAGSAITGLPVNYTLMSENTVALRPDGKLIYTGRVDTNSSGFGGERVLGFSSDGGATLAYDSTLPNYSVVNYGMCQLDPTGALGTYGKVAISGPWRPTMVGNGPRSDLRIRMSTADKFDTITMIAPFNTARYIGYSSIARLDTNLIAMAFEAGTIPFNVDNSAHLAIIDLTP